jgi:alpha-mannosidase
MPKHTIHVISHTHWDREWYMPFEKHRRRLVTLFDNLLDLMDQDPEFRHFHADGQIIPLDDYLEIRPQALPRLQKAAAEGRLSIGPWYVLQDEFLTSGEANLRNMALGLKLSRRFGQPCLLGYLPDSFGNIGQMPQILRGFGIDNAVFGRGINRFDPDVKSDDPAAQGYKSEFTWRSPDGSEVLGVFMANWYANAMTIPATPDEVGPYIEKTRDACLAFSTTSQLLFMNGCDHTPSQPDISAALALANEKVADAELVHSSFDAYLEALRNEVKDLQVKQGEMRSEYTDGWGTLTNVLSSRLYQKRANWECQTLLEKGVEPLGILALKNGGAYDEDLVWYAWKTLMQNHPHDSICGCSCDEVHREMDTRFEKCAILSRQLCLESIEHLATQVDTSHFADALKSVVVYNPSPHRRSDIVEARVDLPADADFNHIEVRDSAGNTLATHLLHDEGVVWDYALPAIGFREPYETRRLNLAFDAELPAGGLGAFGVYPASDSTATATTSHLENQYLRVEFHPNGSFDLIDKEQRRRYKDLHRLEDSLDCGDEYNYRIPADDHHSHPQADATRIGPIQDNGVFVQCQVQTALVVRDRSLPLSYTLRLGHHSRRLDIHLELENSAANHRLRVLFPTDVDTTVASADGQFDHVERPITPTAVWENPSNCQPQQAFVDVSGADGGLLLANRGLPEYEILQDGRNTIALTLLRAVDQLGDWGVFPTPQAQCHGTFTCDYALVPHAGSLEQSTAADQAYQFNTPLHSAFTSAHPGSLNPGKDLLELAPRQLVLSAFKKADGKDSLIVRFYNPTSTTHRARLAIGVDYQTAYLCDLAENRLEQLYKTSDDVEGNLSIETPAKSIITVELA